MSDKELSNMRRRYETATVTDRREGERRYGETKI